MSSPYVFKVPCTSKRAVGRATHQLNALVPTEELQDEFNNTPDMRDQLETAINSKQLPSSYDSHPIVMGSPDPVVPLSLFIDGVPYSNTDGVIGFWLANLITQRRHLIIALRTALEPRAAAQGHT